VTTNADSILFDSHVIVWPHEHYSTAELHMYTVSERKTCCRIFAITWSTVDQFWKFFHWWILR